MSSSILDDPSYPPELREMIKQVRAEYDRLKALQDKKNIAIEMAPNPGRLAPRDVKKKKPTAAAAPPVEEDPVTLFDRDNAFGPRVGITRLTRYLRAVKFNDNPDPRVMEAMKRDKSVAAYVYTA